MLYYNYEVLNMVDDANNTLIRILCGEYLTYWKTAALQGVQSASSFRFDDRELHVYIHEAGVTNGV